MQQIHEVPFYILPTTFPTSVRIGHETWKVEEVPDASLENYEGYTNFDARAIFLAKGKQVDIRAGILLHELFHALWALYGLPEDSTMEERVVTCFGSGLAKLIQDNPTLFENLLSALKVKETMHVQV